MKTQEPGDTGGTGTPDTTDAVQVTAPRATATPVPGRPLCYTVPLVDIDDLDSWAAKHQSVHPDEVRPVTPPALPVTVPLQRSAQS